MKLWSAHDLEMLLTTSICTRRQTLKFWQDQRLAVAEETVVLSTQELMSATAGEVLVDTVEMLCNSRSRVKA